LVTPEEAQKLCPLIAVDDLKGGLWIPGDGVGDPYQICLSLITSAKEGGKKTRNHCFTRYICHYCKNSEKIWILLEEGLVVLRI
jgi:glycine/D-amino acid oxidase-like deaminating enzyme